MNLIEERIPKDRVLSAVEEFLQSADHELEMDNRVISFLSSDTFRVISRAYVISDDDEGFGDHFEAGVGLGAEELDDGSWSYTKGILRIYFSLDGEMITEDRFPPPA